jgi:hypothetical protein
VSAQTRQRKSFFHLVRDARLAFGSVVQQLLADERVELGSFPDTDAYAVLYPILNKVMVLARVGDPTKHHPPSNITFLTPKASLVVRSDTHSAIQYLLLNTAR